MLAQTGWCNSINKKFKSNKDFCANYLYSILETTRKHWKSGKFTTSVVFQHLNVLELKLWRRRCNISTLLCTLTRVCQTWLRAFERKEYSLLILWMSSLINIFWLLFTNIHLTCFVCSFVWFDQNYIVYFSDFGGYFRVWI